MENYKTISNKFSIDLKKNTNDDYLLQFDIKNDRIDVYNFLQNTNVYKLLHIVNPILIEKIDIEKDENDKNKKHILYLYKSFNKDFGIKKKYMYIECKENYDSTTNTIIYNSHSIPYYKSEIFNTHQLLTCNFMTINIKIITTNSVRVNINFNLNIHEELPIYMNNLIGTINNKYVL